MKKIVVVALLVMSALVTASLSTQAQVKVHVQLAGSWQNLSTCPPVFTSGGIVSLVESKPDDFFGDNGASNNSYYTLNIALPPGLAFDPTGASVWSNATSANLQNGTGTVTYSWTDVDDSVLTNYGINLAPQSWPSTYPGEVNTISIRGMMVKNTHKLDSIYLTPVRIKVLPGSGPITPSGNFFAWTCDESGARRPGLPLNDPDAFVRGLPQIGTVSGIGSVITTTPGTASAIKFVIEPAVAPILNEVQASVAGVGVATMPTIQAVDCNGYYTGVGLSGKDVTLTLLDATQNTVTSNATLWNGVGPTYSGSTASVNPSPSSSWSGSGSMPLTFSVTGVNLTENFTIRASATGLTAATSANIFTVQQRVVSWSSLPVIDPPTYNGSTYDVTMSGSPQVFVEDMYGNPVSGASTRMDLHPSTAVPAYAAMSPIGSAPHSQNALSAVTGYANYTNTFIFTLTGSQLNPPPQYRAIAYVYTPFYTTFVNSGSLYLDPRYALDNQLITNNGLPVELTTFTASLRNQTVSLKWSTATETNNYGFEVERSDDGQTWSNIGFVAGNGTTSSQRDYSFTNRLTETDMMRPTLSYRLRQIDRDGTFEYSPVVTVALAPAAQSVTLMQNFPNPFNPSTNISFNLPEAGAVTMTVYNELGMQVARLLDNASFDAGWHTASFNASELPSGVYMYTLQTAAGTSTKTMIVSK